MPDLTSLRSRLEAIGARLEIERLRSRAEALQKESGGQELWEDQERAVAVLSELNSTKALVGEWDEIAEFLALDSLAEEELVSLDAQIVSLERQALLSGRYDRRSAVLSVHAGTGGVEAQDWAEMLLRMYLRYCEQGSTEQPEDRTLSLSRTGWKTEVIELARGEEAGIKKAVVEVQGAFAYGLLKAEAGVHRLVRLSPFNAKNLRQTSFALVEVIPELESGEGVKIDEKELRIDVYRSGGHGGQGVNTTDSAVRITHLPTNTVVAVQNERSQHQNKATAMKILLSKLQRLQEVKEAQEAAMVKGEVKEGSWGNQIRSYVMQPYQMVKDHRTDCETSDVQGVLDGALKPFIESYLLSNK